MSEGTSYPPRSLRWYEKIIAALILTFSILFVIWIFASSSLNNERDILASCIATAVISVINLAMYSYIRRVNKGYYQPPTNY